MIVTFTVYKLRYSRHWPSQHSTRCSCYYCKEKFDIFK